MGAFVLQDAVIQYTTGASTAAHTDISHHVKSVALAAESETQDDSAMGDNWRSHVGGLKSWTFDLECNQDFSTAVGSTDFWQTMGSTAVHWIITPTTGGTTSVASATNPQFRGYAMLKGSDPVSGTVGDLAVVSFTFTGVGALTRGTSSNTG